MAKNDFKAFATDRNANVMSQEEWEALPALLSGFTAGKASSAQVNKVIRQASFIAAALAQFVSDKTQRDVLDNGDLPGFVELLGSGFAVEYLSRKNPFGDIKSDGTVPTALANLGLLGGINSSAVGRLLNVQKFSSSQTYTKTPGAKFGIVEAVGGGGAGGSPAHNASGYMSGGGGGNSGCYVRFLVDLSSVDSVSCIIGAGGTPVAQQGGGIGGDTAFGSYATALGGNGGLLLASTTSPNIIYGMSPSRGKFGSISNAVLLDYNYGGLGGDAVIMSPWARAGLGGASKLGGQTFGPGIDTQGINATTYGGGGSGAVATSATNGTNLLGGNGAGGVIIVWEYA
ncbi:TPA: hypothetical protein NU305_000769 [Escherichia coli]|nr:hypothetical protein [Escherichia coli]